MNRSNKFLAMTVFFVLTACGNDSFHDVGNLAEQNSNTNPSAGSAGIEQSTASGGTAGLVEDSSTGGESSNGTCEDNSLNGDETDIDCGGLRCDQCELGSACLIADDCTSAACRAGICVESVAGNIGYRCNVDGNCGPDLDCYTAFVAERGVCTSPCETNSQCPATTACVDAIPGYNGDTVGPYCLQPCTQASDCSELGSLCEQPAGLEQSYCF